MAKPIYYTFVYEITSGHPGQDSGHLGNSWLPVRRTARMEAEGEATSFVTSEEENDPRGCAEPD